jgi:hypothetical protein
MNKVMKRYRQEGKREVSQALNNSMDAKKQVRFENGSNADPSPRVQAAEL